MFCTLACLWTNRRLRIVPSTSGSLRVRCRLFRHGLGLDDGGHTPASLSKIAAESIGNIEEVWADLCLSGQNPQSSDVWAKHVHDAAMGLFESYGKTRTLLEQFAPSPAAGTTGSGGNARVVNRSR